MPAQSEEAKAALLGGRTQTAEEEQLWESERRRCAIVWRFGLMPSAELDVVSSQRS